MLGKILAVAAAMAVSAPAFAADRIVDVSSVDGVAALMREEGYLAEIKVSKDGSPYIDSAIDGNDLRINFYGCKNNAGCDSFDFYNWVEKEPFFSTEMANDWNANNRFLKVAIDSDGDLSEYAYISTVGKMTYDNFKDYLAWYGSTATELAEFVAERRKAAASAKAK
jgi:hypothetical protein